MVFNNYDNLVTFLNIQDFIPQSDRDATLFTSGQLDSNIFVISQSNDFLDLSGLDRGAIVGLFVQQSQTYEIIFEDAKIIVRRLRYYVLAITKIEAYIKRQMLQLYEFIDHYKRQKKIILECRSQVSHYKEQLYNSKKETLLSVFITGQLSFQQFQLEILENNVRVKLLTLVAFFDEKNIAEQVFSGFGVNQEYISDGAKLLICFNIFSSVEGE